MAAGTAPAGPHRLGAAPGGLQVSRGGSPWATTLVSSATTGPPRASASATSGAIRIRSMAATLAPPGSTCSRCSRLVAAPAAGLPSRRADADSPTAPTAAARRRRAGHRRRGRAGDRPGHRPGRRAEEVRPHPAAQGRRWSGTWLLLTVVTMWSACPSTGPEPTRSAPWRGSRPTSVGQVVSVRNDTDGTIWTEVALMLDDTWRYEQAHHPARRRRHAARRGLRQDGQPPPATLRPAKLTVQCEQGRVSLPLTERR